MSELIDGSKGHPADAVPAGGSQAAMGQGAPADDAVVRRTKDGWRVGDADLPDLTSAMVLADLISAELAEPEPAAQAGPGETAAPTATAGRAAETADTVVAAAVATDGSGRSGKAKGKASAKSKDAAATET